MLIWKIFKLVLFVGIVWVAFVLYERLSWYFDKRTEARVSASTLAGMVAALRSMLYRAVNDPDEREELDKIFRAIQLCNLKMAYGLGGTYLQEEVLHIAETTPEEDPMRSAKNAGYIVKDRRQPM